MASVPLEFDRKAGRQRIFASNVSRNDAMCGEQFCPDSRGMLYPYQLESPRTEGGQPIVEAIFHITWEIASAIGGFPVEFWQRNRLGWGYEVCVLGVGRQNRIYTLTWSFSDGIDIFFSMVSRISLRRRRDEYSSVLSPAQIRSHE